MRVGLVGIGVKSSSHLGILMPMDGVEIVARFNKPEDVLVDSQGNVFIADTDNYTNRKIIPERQVTTFAGVANEPGYQAGPGKEARFYKPIEIATDGEDNLYVADSSYEGPEMGNSLIRMITPDGYVSTIAGQPGKTGSTDGDRSEILFHKFVGIDVTPDGIIYIADTEA